MKKIEIFVGSDSAFEKIVPKSARNLSEMAAKLDDGNKKMDVFVNIPGQPEPKSKKKKKPRVQDFVIHADEYCSVQEHVIINFINFIFQMSITNMYIQNPPKNIREQIYRTFDKSIIHETQQPYLEVSKEMIQTFNRQYSERVIGQEKSKKKLLQAIYPLVDGKQSKPVVILLYVYHSRLFVLDISYRTWNDISNAINHSYTKGCISTNIDLNSLFGNKLRLGSHNGSACC